MSGGKLARDRWRDWRGGGGHVSTGCQHNTPGGTWEIRIKWAAAAGVQGRCCDGEGEGEGGVLEGVEGGWGGRGGQPDLALSV